MTLDKLSNLGRQKQSWSKRYVADPQGSTESRILDPRIHRIHRPRLWSGCLAQRHSEKTGSTP